MQETRKFYLASMWGLEDIGAREFQEQTDKIVPDAQTRYVIPDSMFIFEGPLSEMDTENIVSCMKDFMQRHQYPDLLDEPRLRSLTTNDIEDTIRSVPQWKEKNVPSLLDVDTHDTINIQSGVVMEQNIKLWSPAKGDLGYFKHDSFQLLPQIAKATNTRIRLEKLGSTLSYIKISGQNSEDAENALERLRVLESPMYLVENTHHKFSLIILEDNGLRFSIVKYASTSPIALGRLLFEPESPSLKEISRCLVPVCHRVERNYPIGPSKMLERHTLIDLGDVDEQTRDIFRLLQPALVPARSFPGVLSLEVQLGLITMSPTSIAENHNVLTLSELERIVAPQSGLDGTISAFHKRLTTSPRDVDHLVDIEKNGCRLFERYPGVLSTQYEFHCATKSGDLVIVSIDDHGATKINRPPKVLGSVHMSFPTHFWDAAVILQGHMEQFKSVDLEIARAAQHIIDNLFIDHLRVQGNRTRVKLQTRCDGYLTINKVWSKQVTRYRCLESTDDGSWTTGLCLQVTEWQDLFISPRLVESDVVEAECTSLGEMVQAHRQWWEASLVSPGIDAVLEENANLSPGEYTTKWKANDLMGTSPASVSIEQSPSSIAIAIGSAGLGALIRLAAIVVENIDTVGYHNAGPLLDLARTASSELSSVESTPLAASRPASGASRRGSKPRTPRDGDGSRFANVVASKGVRGVGQKDSKFW